MVEIVAAPPFTWETLVQAVAAVGALGAASVGLVDATKFARGGVSNAGYRALQAGLKPYAAAFRKAIGADWEDGFRNAWLNGAAKADQLSGARNYIRLGLAQSTVDDLTPVIPVDVKAFRTAVGKIEAGKPLTPQEFDLVGRFDASVDARLGAAYDRAEQIYRSGARTAAGGVSIGLALLAWWIVLAADAKYFGLSLLAGIVAVPIAPVIKDLLSALSASASAAKALKPGS